MQLFPTRTGAHLAVAGLTVTALGVVARTPAMLGWGASIVVAVAIARAATVASIARIRAAGFEMLWTGSKRVARSIRGGLVEIEAEIRNRDTRSASFVRLRAIASPALQVTVSPNEGEVPRGSSLKVRIVAETPRVGHHGIHGLALEVRGSPGLFDVPLSFSNPYCIIN